MRSVHLFRLFESDISYGFFHFQSQMVTNSQILLNGAGWISRERFGRFGVKFRPKILEKFSTAERNQLQFFEKISCLENSLSFFCFSYIWSKFLEFGLWNALTIIFGQLESLCRFGVSGRKLNDWNSWRSWFDIWDRESELNFDGSWTPKDQVWCFLFLYQKATKFGRDAHSGKLKNITFTYRELAGL